jgi:hypothetical protein
MILIFDCSVQIKFMFQVQTYTDIEFTCLKIFCYNNMSKFFLILLFIKAPFKLSQFSWTNKLEINNFVFVWSINWIVVCANFN